MKTEFGEMRSRLPRLSTVGFFCALVTLIAGLGWTIVMRRSLTSSIDKLHQELVPLKVLSSQRQAGTEQSNRDRIVLMNVLGHCRNVADVPDLGGSRIVAKQLNGEAIAFYVPDGQHTLSIKLSWETTDSRQAQDGRAEQETAEPDSKSEAAGTGEQSWSIPLIARRGYFLAMIVDSHREGPIGWELTSNDQEFAAKKELLQLPTFRGTGASWSHYQVAGFPNEIDLHAIISKNAPSDPQLATRIGKWTKFGRVGNANLKVQYEVALSSDNPAVVSATNAETLLVLRKWDRITTYLGDGRYGINPQRATTPDSIE